MARHTPPTHAQIQHFQSLLERDRQELSQLENTILKVSLVLSELRFQKQRRMDSLTALGRILSPIRRVPPEILSEIFQWCCHMNLYADDRRITNVRAPPLLLGQVSSLWREVSQNTPRLWDHLCFFDDALATEQMLPVLRLLFHWSGTLPVTMELIVCPGDTGQPLAPMFEFHPRLQKLHLYLLSSDSLSTQRMPFPILKSLWVQSVVGADETLLDVLSICQNAPNLRILRVHSPHFSSNMADSPFPWSQLTRLDLTMPLDTLAARDILLRCTQLATCHFHHIQPVDFEHPSPPCTLHNLHSLKFYGTQCPWAPFISPFSMPKLQTLSISDVHCSADVLSQFISRSQFKLNSLTLSSVSPLDSDDIIRLLRQLPSLDTLHLSRTGISNYLFRTFIHIAGSSPPLTLSSLQNLTIEASSDHLNGAAIADMVESLVGNAGFRQDGSSNSNPFAAMSSLKLALGGSRFSVADEGRLAEAVATGFLVDIIERE
ncbi:hypothetical protein C8R46DRAFT_1235722 [Mycena filopes]|nr:hypothetical protein C8R46DRAFT_1235722 [Mycena filopes]